MTPDVFPEGETHFFIEGPVGKLETITLKSGNTAFHDVAIICHPHPLKEGTMHNKVVHTLSRAFMRQGISAVRFNYRGVGQSEGSYGDSLGEIADLMAIITWVNQVIPNPAITLAGFSFGAYIAASGASQILCRQLFSIAPAVNIQPYDQLPPIPCPWVIIQGENDEVIKPQWVYDWFERTSQKAIAPMQLLKLKETSHFFHGKLIELRDLVERSICK